MCSNPMNESSPARSAKVKLKHPIVLPIVPANVMRKLGLRRPLSKFGGVNLAVKAVIATSMISIPNTVIEKPRV